MDVQQNQTFLTEGKPPPYVFIQLQHPARACLSASVVSPLLSVVTASLPFTLLCACVAPCSEELAEDDLGDLQALVSGVTQVRGPRADLAPATALMVGRQCFSVPRPRNPPSCSRSGSRCEKWTMPLSL